MNPAEDVLHAPARYAPLQLGHGAVRGAHYLPTTPGTALWGRLPCAADRPVLRVRPGDTVTVDTLSHEGLLEDQGRDPLAFFGAHGVAAADVLDDAVEIARDLPHAPGDGPHVVTGPIAVSGARPGDLLAVTVLETTPRVPYGVISNRHGRGALPGEMPEAPGTVSVFTPVDGVGASAVGLLPLVPGGPARVRFPLRPFLGTIGVATPGGARPHSVPPGPHGGNLDIALLVAASLRATLRFDIVPAADARRSFGAVRGPVAETADHLVPTGLDADLDAAVADCVRNTLALLGARYGMDRSLALAYLSAATDFDISQVVDVVKGCHARIRKADFAV
jgi:acetamidase/formamidase